MNKDNSLPASWSLAEIAEVSLPGETWSPKTARGGEFSYIDIDAVDNIGQRIAAPKTLAVADAPSRARVLVKAGDVLFSLVRPYLKNIAVVPKELDGQVASTAFIAVRPAEGIDSSFVFRQVVQESFINSVPTYGNSPPSARDDEFARMKIWDGEIPECVHQNHVFRARMVHDDIQSKFVSVQGNTFGRLWFQEHGKQSVNLASINMTVLRQFPVPLPPAKEQDEIVREVEDRLSVIDKAAVGLEAGLKRAAILRQSILKRAFEGKLVPQDPNDEPASVLLERIRKARAAQEPLRAPRRRKSRKTM